MMSGYWAGRRDLHYYRCVRDILDEVGPLGSILDVGPLDTPAATWGNFSRRYTIDPLDRPELPGVSAIRGLWPDAADEIPLPVDVITCLQVIEHLTDTRAFAASLFASARVAVIISVPYCWPAGACSYHVHDPINEQKLQQLVGREPNASTIVTDGGTRRLVCRYDHNAGGCGGSC